MGNAQAAGCSLDMCSGGGDKGVKITKIAPQSHAAGIGAVFGVDATGAVFFNTAVPGSSCGDAAAIGKLKTGDVLHSVDGAQVFRAPLNVIAAKLLGPPQNYSTEQSHVTVVFKRDDQAAQKAIDSAKELSGVDRIRYAQDSLQ